MLAPDGSFKPLGFYSAHLSDTQKKYSVFKKELLGAFKSLRHFLPEVYGKHLVIYVDHLPLVQAFKSNTIPLNDPQTYRQITELGRFTRDIRHVSGVDNVFADFLSRIKEENKGTAYQEEAEPELAAAEEVQLQLMSLDTLVDLQANDPEVAKIREGDKPKGALFSQEVIEGRSLLCEVTTAGRPRPYVPQALRQQTMSSLHNFDHKGIKTTTSS